MTDSLDDFLSSAGVARSCDCCKNVPLAEELVAYLDKLAAGKTAVRLQTVFENYLLPKYERPKGITSIRNHVRKCLRRDPMTGKALDE